MFDRDDCLLCEDRPAEDDEGIGRPFVLCARGPPRFARLCRTFGWRGRLDRSSEGSLARFSNDDQSIDDGSIAPNADGPPFDEPRGPAPPACPMLDGPVGLKLWPSNDGLKSPPPPPAPPGPIPLTDPAPCMLPPLAIPSPSWSSAPDMKAPVPSAECALLNEDGVPPVRDWESAAANVCSNDWFIHGDAGGSEGVVEPECGRDQR